MHFAANFLSLQQAALGMAAEAHPFFTASLMARQWQCLWSVRTSFFSYFLVNSETNVRQYWWLSAGHIGPSLVLQKGKTFFKPGKGILKLISCNFKNQNCSDFSVAARCGVHLSFTGALFQSCEGNVWEVHFADTNSCQLRKHGACNFSMAAAARSSCTGTLFWPG